MRSPLPLPLLALLLLAAAPAAASVIGLDLSADYLKVALIQSGVPFEIVPNFHSKRKTDMVVTFYKDQRFYGSDAAALMARSPETSFSRVMTIIGKSIDSPAVSALKEHYLGMDVYFNETRGGVCLREGNTYYTPEELLSMIMTHAQEMVKAHGGTHIRDCVITVPAFFTQHERRAVYDAAAIADMNVLSMIDDNTAAALQFAIDRTVEEPQTILYYNLGSSSAQVTIVEHSSYRVVEGGQNKSIGTLEVKGKSWDTTQGGYEFDLRLTELLADRFNAQHAKHSLNVRENVRAMTKLRTHARKIKEVLSANQKIPATAESLHQDYDLRTEVSRTDFENAAADLFDRLLVPIDRALRDANMTKDQISLVEVIGGSVRIPKVQAILREYFGDKELGMHLNGDESMALGTAFRAANLSTAFRVRRIGMQEVTSFPIKVELEGIDQPSGFLSRMANMFSKSDNAGEEQGWFKSSMLYPAHTKLPTGKAGKKKTINISHDKDILCKLAYEQTEDLPEGTHPVFAVYNITGIADFAREWSSKGLTPKVHLSFHMDSSGMVSLASAEATVEEVIEEGEQKPADAEGAAPAEQAADGEEAAEQADSDAANETAAESTGDAGSENKEVKRKVKLHKKRLRVVEHFEGVVPRPYTQTELANSKARIRELKRLDEIRAAKEAAKNNLEAYIYSVRNRFGDQEEELRAVSTDEQREEAVTLANELEDWLYDEQDLLEVSEYKAREASLREKAEAVFFRHAELTARPAAIESATKYFDKVRKTLADWEQNKPWITEEERQKVTDAITKVEDWLKKKQDEQSQRKPHETPAFNSQDVQAKLKPLKALVDSLKKKPKPAPPKETTPKEEAPKEDAQKDDASKENAEQKDEAGAAANEADGSEQQTETTENADAPKTEDNTAEGAEGQEENGEEGLSDEL